MSGFGLMQQPDHAGSVRAVVVSARWRRLQALKVKSVIRMLRISDAPDLLFVISEARVCAAPRLPERQFPKISTLVEELYRHSERSGKIRLNPEHPYITLRRRCSAGVECPA